MKKPRKRRPTDSEFFVELVDKDGEQRRVAIGNYWAISEGEAIDMAQRQYPSFVASLQTNKHKFVARIVTEAERRMPTDAQRKDDLFTNEKEST